MATAGTQLVYADPEEELLGRLHLSDAALLITADSSAPADQTPQSLHAKGLVESLLPSEISQARQVSIICIALNILIFQASTEQLTKHGSLNGLPGTKFWSSSIIFS